jgi:hypothetical protein
MGSGIERRRGESDTDKRGSHDLVSFAPTVLATVLYSTVI